eukprot:SAG11_NODE_37167_length_258_cov_0.647799_1_plen_64_part_01
MHLFDELIVLGLDLPAKNNRFNFTSQNNKKEEQASRPNSGANYFIVFVPISLSRPKQTHPFLTP